MNEKLASGYDAFFESEDEEVAGSGPYRYVNLDDNATAPRQIVESEPVVADGPSAADAPSAEVSGRRYRWRREPDVVVAQEVPESSGTLAMLPARPRPAGPPRAELTRVLDSPELPAEVGSGGGAALRSTTGVRGALNRVGFRIGLSPAEQAAEQRRERIRRQLINPYQVAVLSVKGGVGRTTTVAALGSVFAAIRPDRVIAVDASPHFGDLATRTRRHPYGLSLRDLARATRLDSFSAVQAYVSVNRSDLATIGSVWTTATDTALTGAEYVVGTDILRKHYSLILVDCGVGVMDSATRSVLLGSDSVIVVTPATVGGVNGALATLHWLGAHGLGELAARSVVAIVQQPSRKPQVDMSVVEGLFEAAQRPTLSVPYDAHLAEGGPIDLRLLGEGTRVALEELAAVVSEDFPGFVVGRADGFTENGRWR
ncbi:MinD/ParA family protein [Nocardia sp. NPDC051832]|uniref:MinD/ParA family ATP-binding protein n=1 Tax=Nocardia sp. NPDC051832 TaxID=3155673 RepID=UPI003420DE6C